MTRRLAAIFTALAALTAPIAHADAMQEKAVSAIFDQIATDPLRLRIFLAEMPKGGDLHNHLGGSVYAESFLSWAAGDGYCIDETGTRLVPPPCPAAKSVERAQTDNPFAYGKLVDALSMRGFQQGVGRDEASGHDHFFSTFERFISLSDAHVPQIMAETRRLAADDRVSYLEEMFNPPAPIAFARGASADPLDQAGLASAYARNRASLNAVVDLAARQLDAEEEGARTRLGCATPAAEPGCAVTVRYLAYGLRDFPPAQVFRLLSAGFALAAKDPRVVGVNLVQPEDWPVALRDYDLHMAMIRFLKQRYPGVHVSLHAGELAFGQVPREALRDHIAKALDAGAQRIGHGTDIALEDGARATMQRMARDNVAVEINLTSNAVILGVKGREHPMRLYLAEGVPLVLSTDDAGVLRTDMTNEYVRAVREQGLRYPDLKRLARASLNYAFISGASLWKGDKVGAIVTPCAASLESSTCESFLANSEKARLQVNLEKSFVKFEMHQITMSNIN